MADVTITPLSLRQVAGTMLPHVATALANYTAQITTGQTFEIVLQGDDRGLQLLLQDSGGSAATWTFDAGDYPPAALMSKGAKTFTPAASDIRPLVLEQGRHMKNSGKITGSVSGGTVKLTAYYNPKGT